MTRVLRPTTIIPENLYVERAADRQLSQIVEDMGRPGYVLVARQMGKTNLLLSMKRKYEAGGDIVVYIDLSNRFDSARACLRNIIDVIIETNSEALGHLEHIVHKERDKFKVEAATEFGRHMRLILKEYDNRKVIVVLDEIDSLINSGYGDIILSQVRSTYFTRVNFPEYERLTYVLSGVAEPTDLIKDKNISPFNIGEKIYLEDFSLKECQNLIHNAGLNLSGVCIDSVFSWTSGHPRMTWDILSALEAKIEAGGGITSGDVDEVVEKLYLKDFDRPPVDHMRVLLEGDAQLRNALISIRYGKGAAVDEKVRGRLYLSGITSSLAATLSIKNRIIDQSLSDSWLAQATKADADPLTIAAEHFAGRRYRLVIETLRSYEHNGGKLPASSRLQLGISLYNTDQFQEAADELRQVTDSLKGDVRTRALYYLGGALSLDGKYAESIPYLEDASQNGTGELVLPARVLLAASYYWSPVPDVAERTSSLQSEILAGLSTEEARDIHVNRVLTASLYNLAIAASQAGEGGASASYFDAAITLASPYMLPTIMITAAEMSSDVSRKVTFAADAANVLIKYGLKYSLDGEATLAFRERTLAALLSALYAPYQADVIEKVLNYAITLYPNIRTKCSLMLKMAVLLEETEADVLLPMIEAVERNSTQELNSKERLTLFRMLATYDKGDKTKRIGDYFRTLENTADFDDLPIEDTIFIVNLVQTMSSEGKSKELIEVVDLVLPKLINSDNMLWAAIIIYFKMQSLRTEKKFSEAKSVASHLLNIAEEVERKIKSPPAIVGFLRTVIQQANTIIQENILMPLDPFRKFGRNQKVIVSNIDGTSERIVKFKVVEQKLREGTLKIVSK